MTRIKAMRAKNRFGSFFLLSLWTVLGPSRPRCFGNLQLGGRQKPLDRNMACHESSYRKNTKMCGMHWAKASGTCICSSLTLARSVVLSGSIPPSLWWRGFFLIWCFLCWRFGSWTFGVVSSVVCIGLTSAGSTELGPICFAPFAIAGAFAAFVCIVANGFCAKWLEDKNWHVGTVLYMTIYGPLSEEFLKLFGAAIIVSFFSFNLTLRAAMIAGFCAGTGFDVIERKLKWLILSNKTRTRCNNASRWLTLGSLYDWDSFDTWHWMNSFERCLWISNFFFNLHACYTAIAARAFAVSPRTRCRPFVTAFLLHFAHNFVSCLCALWGRRAWILLMLVDLCETLFFLCLFFLGDGSHPL